MYWNPHHQHISAVFDLFFYVTCFFGFYFLNITRCMLWCCKTASQCCICPHGSIKNLYKAQLSELEALCGILQARDWWKVQHTQKVLRVESMTYIQTPVNKGSFIKVTVTPPFQICTEMQFLSWCKHYLFVKLWQILHTTYSPSHSTSGWVMKYGRLLFPPTVLKGSKPPWAAAVCPSFLKTRSFPQDLFLNIG